MSKAKKLHASVAGGDPGEVPMLNPKDMKDVPSDYESMRLHVGWATKQNGIMCDLDLNLYCYDERARFTEKVTNVTRLSKDGSSRIYLEQEANEVNNAHIEVVKIDFRQVKPTTTAVLLFLDGGSRNFQYLQAINILSTKVLPDRAFSEFLPPEEKDNESTGPLFQIYGRTRKNYQSLALCILYKDGWDDVTNYPRWVAKSFMEPVSYTSSKDRDESLCNMVIEHVPVLEKYKPKLFSSVPEICAALSSHALPKLKKRFQKDEEGLAIAPFTEVLFKQLYETHPRIVEESEAAYVIAMLQEMFYQIDYNGDNNCNWDEFTSFCVQVGVSIKNAGASANGFQLDQYHIEYNEDGLHRDRYLSPHRTVLLMRHVGENHKILVIPQDSDNVLILNEDFKLHAQLYPSKVQVIGSLSKESEDAKNSRVSAATRIVVYDIIFLGGRDMYCYTASDHSITICKEFSSMGGKKNHYLQHNKFYHTLLHLKLCWSAKHELLCSAASDRVIYGWNIDTGAIVFQLSRHNDIITDFIAVDDLDIFITCSMDKRIVMWSMTSRRVKGVLLGHKRGVRALSQYDNLLLSAGFECEAKLWDLHAKDRIGVLKGHRHPIAAATLMCSKAQSEKDNRAITVDESGEFRLWNLYVRERSNDIVFIPTLQVFEMQNSETPLNQFRFLACPYNAKTQQSYYSELIGCSTKLCRFLPEKNTKEFVPPGMCLFNDGGSLLMTVSGKSLLFYECHSGQFHNIFEDLDMHDISATCFDGERGRKCYVGLTNGDMHIVNSTTGAIIDTKMYHTKEITAIRQVIDAMRTAVYTSSRDGHIRMFAEGFGKLHIHNSIENAFGERTQVSDLHLVPAINALVAVSLKSWGIWDSVTLKKNMIINQHQFITAFTVVGNSRDKDAEAFKATQRPDMHVVIDKECFLTVAVAMTSGGIQIYTLDLYEFRGVNSFELVPDVPMYITDMTILRYPEKASMNYSSNAKTRASLDVHALEGNQLVAVTDEGSCLIWNAQAVRQKSDELYRETYRGVPVVPLAAHVASRKQLISAARRRTSSKHVPQPVIRKHVRHANGTLNYEANSIPFSDVHSHAHAHVPFSKEQGGDSEHIHQTDNFVDSGKTDEHIHNNHAEIKSNLVSKADHKYVRIRKNLRENTAHHGDSHHVMRGYTDKGGHAPTTDPFGRPLIHYNDHQAKGHSEFHISTNSHEVEYLYSEIGDLAPEHGQYGHHHEQYGHHNGHHSRLAHPTTLHRDHYNQPHRQDVHHSSLPGHKADGHLDDVPSSSSSSTFILTESDTSQAEKKKSASGGSLSLIMDADADDIFHKRNYHPAEELQARIIFQAHSDAIPSVVSMAAHGCFVTLSLDGYHRVWNLEGELLGELQLPNVTDAMKAKSMCKESGSSWKFILERLTVTKYHVDMAAHLTMQVLQTRKEKAALAAADRRKDNLLLGFKGFKDPAESEESDTESPQAQLRAEMIASLTAPSVGPMDAPPDRLPTKEERDLIKMSLDMAKLDAKTFTSSQSIKSSAFSTLDSSLLDDESSLLSPQPVKSGVDLENSIFTTTTMNGEKRSTTPKNDVSRTNSGKRTPLSKQGKLKAMRVQKENLKTAMASILSKSNGGGAGDSTMLMASLTGGPSLWFVPGQKDIFGNNNTEHDVIDPPFSDGSLRRMMREGAIDGEGMRILRKIGRDDEAVNVYDRSQPTLLLRNATLSTSVTLPPLGGGQITEIKFGVQKDMYKNAKKELLEKDRTSSAQQRFSIASARIEMNVNRVKNMTHLIQPLSHEEVILPKANGESEEELNKLRTEEQRMQLRLMKSAALVPADAVAKARPLDKDSLSRWQTKVKEANSSAGTDNKFKVRTKQKARLPLSQVAVNNLENKLMQAIRGEYRARVRKNRDEKIAQEAQRLASMPPAPLLSSPQQEPIDKNTALKGGMKQLSIDTAAPAIQRQPSSLFSPLIGSPMPAQQAKTVDQVFEVKEEEDNELMDEEEEDEDSIAAAATKAMRESVKQRRTGLTTRQLLPYYKLEAVHQFMDIFAKVDENFSGDIDVNEWIQLFGSLGQSIPEQEARMIFMKIDKDSDGFLSMRELVPVVFSKATYQQQKLIIQYTELELIKKIDENLIPKISIVEIEALFEAYDLGNVGYVDVSHIRERLRTMNLPENCLYAFMESIQDLADDEMVNLVEFKRILRMYTKK